MCFDSCERPNKDWKFHVLDLKKAEVLIDRFNLFSNATWGSMTIQAKSDVIRINLLAKYGGVWIDSTVYCNENRPLDEWLDRDLQVFFLHNHPNGGILLHSRPVPPKKFTNVPWGPKNGYRFASWFIAAQTSSILIQKLKTMVNSFWSVQRLEYEYYWLHHLFFDLIKSDEASMAEFVTLGMWSTKAAYCNTSNHLDAPFHKFDYYCGNYEKWLLHTSVEIITDK